MNRQIKDIAQWIFYWLGYEPASAASLTPELEGEVPAEGSPPADLHQASGAHSPEGAYDQTGANDQGEARVRPGEITSAAGRSPSQPQSGMLLMATGALFFSLMSLCVKVAGERLPSQEIVLVRALFTLAISYLMLRATRTRPWGNHPRLLIGRGIVGFIGLSGFYYSVVNLPLADATVIQYTNPIFAALLAVPILGERMRMREVLAFFGCMAGVLLMAQPSFLIPGMTANLQPAAVAVGVMGALGSGSAYVLVRKLRDLEHPTVIVFYFALVSVVLALPAAVVGALWPTPQEWLILIGVGLTTQLGQVSITRGLSLEKAGRATAVGYLQIVFAMIWSILFLSVWPNLGTMCGAVLIVASTVFMARK